MDLASSSATFRISPSGDRLQGITPLLADPRRFVRPSIAWPQHYARSDVDAVAAAEARGFLFARRWRWR